MRPYYQDSAVTIYHASSVECIPDCFSPECVITDPPYGVGFKYDQYKDSAENFDGIRNLVERLVARSNQMALMMGQRQLWTMPRPRWMLCWAKPGSTRRNDLGGFNEWEPIGLYGEWKGVWNDLKVLPDCVNHSKDIASEHPCPKPLNLLHWLVSLSSFQHICDPFMGSGITLRAAKNLGRKATGWEISEKYCEIAARLMEQEVLAFDVPLISSIAMEPVEAMLL